MSALDCMLIKFITETRNIPVLRHAAKSISQYFDFDQV
jgi:hypothetical protein